MAVQTVTELKMFIGGEWVGSSSGEWIDVLNPATGELVGRVPAGTEADVDRAVRAAREAFRDGRWRSLWTPQRVAILNKLADLIDEHTPELAELETAQTGTTLKLRRDSDIPFAADNLRFFATSIRHLEGKAAGEYSTDHTSMTRRADRSGRPDRAMELPVHDGHLEDRAGARGGQLGRAEACDRDATDDAQAG